MSSIIYRDELPDGCPNDLHPKIIRADQSVFHFVQDDPERDFQSQRTINPDKQFPSADECIARGVSVFETAEDAQRATVRHWTTLDMVAS